jgi:hypothetical protein
MSKQINCPKLPLPLSFHSNRSINVGKDCDAACDLLMMQIEVFDSLVLQHGGEERIISTPHWRGFVRVSPTCNWRVSVPLDEMTQKTIHKGSSREIQIVVFTLRRNARIVHKEISVIPVRPHIATFEHSITIDEDSRDTFTKGAYEEQMVMETAESTKKLTTTRQTSIIWYGQEHGYVSTQLLLLLVLSIFGLVSLYLFFKKSVIRHDNTFPSFCIPVLWTAETERCNTEKLLQAMTDSRHDSVVIFSASSTPTKKIDHPIGCAG